MEWIVAGCGAVLTLAAVCIARKKTGLEPSDRKKWLAALLLAGVGGFASGFLLILRVGTYLPNLLRLLLLGAFLGGGGLYGCPEPPDTESGRAWYGGGVCRMYAPGFPVQRDGCGCYDGKRTCFGRCVFLGVLSGQNGFARRCRIRRYKDDHRSSPYLWRLRDFQLSADITRCGGTGGNRAVDLQKSIP